MMRNPQHGEFLREKCPGCHLTKGREEQKSEVEDIYSLAKYGPEGELLWYADYTPEELLELGAATEDGRVFLFNYGEGGHVFAFGQDGRGYGYCLVGDEPQFTEIGGMGKCISALFIRWRFTAGERAESVCVQGVVCGVMTPKRGKHYAFESFAINSVSGNKEGAWGFLEYLLSGELRGMLKYWFTGFPVKKDGFEEHMVDLYVNPLYVNEYFKLASPTEEDIAHLRDMVDSAVYQGWSKDNNPVRNIVEEEAQMYFAGDCPLEETVEKIQRRVQLYLDEM